MPLWECICVHIQHINVSHSAATHPPLFFFLLVNIEPCCFTISTRTWRKRIPVSKKKQENETKDVTVAMSNDSPSKTNAPEELWERLKLRIVLLGLRGRKSVKVKTQLGFFLWMNIILCLYISALFHLCFSYLTYATPPGLRKRQKTSQLMPDPPLLLPSIYYHPPNGPDNKVQGASAGESFVGDCFSKKNLLSHFFFFLRMSIAFRGAGQ